MTHPHKPRRRQRAMAARQALSLCEAELPGPASDAAGMPTIAGSHRGHHRSSGVAARAALRAAGLPPDLAAALRSRLRLAPETEARS